MDTKLPDDGNIRKTVATTTTRQVPLTLGLYAIVDATCTIVDQALWHVHGGRWTYYARGRVDGELIFMHRLIVGEIPEGLVVDHINGNGWDNREANLRVVTQSENEKNKRRRRKPPFHGIRNRGGRWEYFHAGANTWLGAYDNCVQCAMKYDEICEMFYSTLPRNFTPEVRQGRAFPPIP